MAHNPGKEEFESRFTPQTDIYENRVVASDNPDSIGAGYPEEANYQDDHSSIINKMWGPKETND